MAESIMAPIDVKVLCREIEEQIIMSIPRENDLNSLLLGNDQFNILRAGARICAYGNYDGKYFYYMGLRCYVSENFNGVHVFKEERRK